MQATEGAQPGAAHLHTLGELGQLCSRGCTELCVCAAGLGAALGLFSPQRLGTLQSVRVVSSQEASCSPQDSVSALLEQTAVELEAVEKKLEESRSTLTSGESW